ncbi:hypothetical protein TWF281_003658 [Arthrobotrys megalospora]
MKVSCLYAAIVLAAAASAAPTTHSNYPDTSLLRRQAPKAAPNSLPLTGAQIKEQFLAGTPPGQLPQEKMQFLTTLPDNVWEELSVVVDKARASLAGPFSEAAGNQAASAWDSLFNGQIPDFANLPTTKPSRPSA